MSTQQVNFYQAIFHLQRQPLSTNMMWLALSFGLVCTLLVSGYSAWQLYSKRMYLRDLESSAAVAATQLGDLSTHMINDAPDPVLQHKIQDFEQVLANQKQIEELIKQHLTESSSGYSGYFFAFARHHNDDLWLTGITIGPHQALSLRGKTNQPEIVPRYLRQLSTESVLKGTEFQVFQLDRPIDEKKATTSEIVDFLVSTDSQEKLAP